MLKQKIIQITEGNVLILTYDPSTFFITPSVYWHKAERFSVIGIAWLQFDMCLRKEL